VDLKLIDVLARAFPQATIALVGPSFLTSSETLFIQQRSNIIVTGPVPYSLVPEYMRGFDVCVTPHVVSAFTESLNPIKLWEYLAAGKPVVATNIAGFRDFPNLINIARDAESFVNLCADALHEGSEKGEERRREARKHSWGCRVDHIERIISDVNNRPSSVGETQKATSYD
jgi:glycosyltransferase involved in cell wall biosynthesis